MKFIPFFVFLLFFGDAAMAGGHQMEVYLRNCVFLSPDQGPYVETSLLIPGNTIRYQKGDNGQYTGGVEIEVYFRQGGEIKAFEKYILTSGEMSDTGDRYVSMIDLRRNQLKPGNYDVEGIFTDVNDTANQAYYKDQLVIFNNEDQLQFSDISLIDRYAETVNENIYSKNGMDLVPYVHNFFPTSVNHLDFYVEIYHSDQVLNDDAYLVSYRIEDLKGNQLYQYAGYKKMVAQPVNPLFRSLQINALPTGNYYLILEAKDKNNELLAEKRIFIQRSNRNYTEQVTEEPSFIENSFVSQIDDKEMMFNLRSLVPIADQNETRSIIALTKSGDLAAMKRYFLSFWLKRAPLEAKYAWQDYKKEVDVVEYNFATTIENGFESARGYIYLKYGKPNERNANNESGAKEYEIWQYYSMQDGQSNVRFVFYNPTLIPNQFELIHSTAIGEINDPQWRQKIYRDFDRGTDPDRTRFRDHFGSDLDDAYDGF